MKIVLLGSMRFASEMIEVKSRLEEMGHVAVVPSDTQKCVENPNLNMSKEHCIQTDIMREYFDEIAQGDAVLALNYDKNNIKNYIGGSVLTELALAYYLKKKLFVLNPLPSVDDVRYAFEIDIMNPVILNGDLGKIA